MGLFGEAAILRGRLACKSLKKPKPTSDTNILSLPDQSAAQGEAIVKRQSVSLTGSLNPL